MNVLRRNIPVMLATAICLLCLARGIAEPQQSRGASSTREHSLRASLRTYLGEHASTAEYVSAFVHLTGRAKPEVILYLTSSDWCGSGGCTMLVLSPVGSAYKLINKVTVTRPPIRVLNSKTNGWHDISVIVGGDGTRAAYEARLRFNGKRYPGNPSMAPAIPLRTNAPGKTAISEDAVGKPLQP